MVKLSNELTTNGFNILPADVVIANNKGLMQYNTMMYYTIHIVMTNVELIINEHKHQLTEGQLAFISPGKDIILGKRYKEKNSVYAIAFSPSFYERSLNDTALLNSELFFSTTKDIHVTRASIPTDEIQKLIVDRMSLYKAKNNNGFYIAAAHNCIEALILDGLLYVDENEVEGDKIKRFTSLDVVNRFRVLLQRHYKEEKKVGYYADLLNVTPRKLTEMTESVLGKSAKELIKEKIISESTRLLKHSSHTISEIAYELGFSDEGNFSTFIKKHTLMTPKELREKNNEIN